MFKLLCVLIQQTVFNMRISFVLGGGGGGSGNNGGNCEVAETDDGATLFFRLKKRSRFDNV